MDSTRPPEVVIEQLTPCRDAAAARAELASALGPTLAPSASWRIRVRFEAASGRLTAHGDVVNADGISVASRSLSAEGNECASLAKGLGVWASLVLDAEVPHATPEAPPAAPEDPLATLPAARSTDLWPTTPPQEQPSTDADLFLRHTKAERTVELGVDVFVMGGTGGGAIMGPSLYGVFETAHGLFLRPAFLIGHSIGNFSDSTEVPATFLASRFDACMRLPGMYLDRRGLQLDLCAGGEVGFSRVDDGVLAAGPPGSNPSQTLPFLAFGPSLGLRGELGNNLSAVVRGVADLSVLRDEVLLAGGSTVTPPVFAGRAEVGLSWSLR